MKIVNKEGKKNEFNPINDVVKMYVCGPTVYDRVHLGNMRSIIIYDIIYRTLIYKYGEQNVMYVRNITDIDDKIINKSIETSSDPVSVANKYSKLFIEDYNRMMCLKPNKEIYATKELDLMVDYIKKIEKTGVTYKNKEGILIDVSKVKTYNSLSGRKFSKNKNNSNVDDKKNYEDFYIWKYVSNDKFGYNTSIGYGKPGWHTECAYISTQYLGNYFDIHGGGIDLKFPHHENERCQAICVNQDENSFAKNYLHHEMLYIDGKKMSKSIGNVINIDTISSYFNVDLTDTEVRFILMSKHYRKKLNLDLKTIIELKNILSKIHKTLNESKIVYNKKSQKLPNDALAFIYDDFNIHGYISVMIKYCSLIKKNQSNETLVIKLLEELQSMAKFVEIIN